MATPINSVRTRVIELADGSYVAQLTTDGMMWADLPHPRDLDSDGQDLADAIFYATRVAMRASQLPSVGCVVWRSDAS